MVIGEALVVEAHEVKNGRIEVVNAGRIFFGFGAEVVTGAVAMAFFDACPSEEASKGIGVVVAAGAVALQERHSTKFGSPDHQGVVEHTALFEIGDKGRGGLVHYLSLPGVGVFDVGVAVPVCDAVSTGRIRAIEELDDADAFLEEASGKDAILGVFFFEVGAGVSAVLFVNGVWFVGEVHHFGNGDLHFACEFVAGDAGHEVGVTGVFFEMAAVEALQNFGSEFVVCGIIAVGPT